MVDDNESISAATPTLLVFEPEELEKHASVMSPDGAIRRMSISVLPIDSAAVGRFNARGVFGRWDVWLNGRLLHDVVHADVDLGFVLCNARDAAGSLMTSGGECIRERRRGSVCCRAIDEAGDLVIEYGAGSADTSEAAV